MVGGDGEEVGCGVCEHGPDERTVGNERVGAAAFLSEHVQQRRIQAVAE
eukprot:CAMPEP_0175985182 /NCGR_PEP_ID=MMETSP0108-20121206/49418_1 /TAXON_ID=195067 ORGANISM="Goniomonas pacifica, Strain CCMP1869" /NCGR_SAMPLE_ID=MMETSP0108 /ASSEMBLY_ACC=CAM_ASM_000204 /LENGTH=48 /DNA_ID= /DNA_START= /DNA_END= /DNA_ORIENTATION=